MSLFKPNCNGHICFWGLSQMNAKGGTFLEDAYVKFSKRSIQYLQWVTWRQSVLVCESELLSFQGFSKHVLKVQSYNPTVKIITFKTQIINTQNTPLPNYFITSTHLIQALYLLVPPWTLEMGQGGLFTMEIIKHWVWTFSLWDPDVKHVPTHHCL